jgi:hypothetical protein
LTTDSVTLPANLNLANLVVRLRYITSVSNLTLNFYEAWLSITN